MATEEKQPVKSTMQKVESARALSPFEEMDRMFDNFLTRGWFRPFQMDWPALPKTSLPFEGKTPNIDVIERDDEIVVKAELPGVDKKDIDLSVTNTKVTIQGKTSHEKKEEKGNYYRCEISRGSYARTISLPAEVDESKAKAVFRDGILELSIPKLQKSKRRTVTIE